MTPQEFVERFDRQITLRYFKDDPKREEQNHPAPWRAAVSTHYYTSDTGRLASEGSDTFGTIEEGFGKTVDAALDDLVVKMISHKRAHAAGAGAAAAELTEEADELERRRSRP